MIGSTLHRFKTNARYLGCDTEGEGLNLAFDRPWQVAYCIADNKKVLSSKVDYIWWPDLKVSKRAAEITHFDYAIYKAQARPAKEVLEEFDAVLYDPSTEVLWQNGLGYDSYIHRNWRRACGKPDDFSYLMRSIDLSALSKALKKGWTIDISSPEAFLAWQYKAYDHVEKGLKTNLEQMGKEEHIEHDYVSLHDALSDIQLMMKVYWKRLYQVEF